MALNDSDFKIGLLVTPDLVSSYMQNLIKNVHGYKQYAGAVGEVLSKHYVWTVWWPSLYREDYWSPIYLNRL